MLENYGTVHGIVADRGSVNSHDRLLKVNIIYIASTSSALKTYSKVVGESIPNTGLVL